MSLTDKATTGGVTIVPTGGCHDCGGRCAFKVHVRDGAIVRVETDDGEEPQLRACVRGRAYRQRVHAPDRLQYPMKRVGPRGEGKFQRISWDEALDTVAGQIRRVRDAHGPAAILAMGYGGSIGQLHSSWGGPLLRLFRMYGGCSGTWGGASGEGSVFASRATYGTLSTGHPREDLAKSRLIIMWGWNPAGAIWSTNTSYSLSRAREAGARIVAVDPRYTQSAATFADQWIAIRPGTDAAMLVAMAYVMIAEDLHDKGFLDRLTVGFDTFADYVSGKEDGVAKTPAWAEAITGVPAVTIASLAREYATARPAALVSGFAPGRTAYGEQFHRAAITLAAMTGNIGIEGGSPAGFGRGLVGAQLGPELPVPRDPLDAGKPSLSGSLDARRRNQRRVHVCNMWDAILTGKSGGYPSDIHMLYIICANPVNQFLNTNRAVDALSRLESIVVHEQFMTPTARFADIVLPANTFWERIDIYRPWLSGPYYLYLNKAIESVGESRSDLEICTELAKRLGVDGYNDNTEDQWLREFFDRSPDMKQDIPDYEQFKRQGFYKVKSDRPLIPFQDQVADPEHHPFPTPSGKIEVYSQQLADLADPELPPIAKYIEPWEGPNDPLARKYPLQLVTIHFTTRSHSIFDNVPWLKELEPQTVWLNARDASARGVVDGDLVRVFNDRGQTAVPAKVTERIMPGVVSMGEGAWYRPGPDGEDRGGCPNVLTRDRHSPAGAFPSNTSLVQVEKVEAYAGEIRNPNIEILNKLESPNG